jgi:hypothetical protein
VFKNGVLFLAAILLFAGFGHAQSNDLAVTLGATFSPSVKGLAICEAILCPPGLTSDQSIEQGFSVGAAYSHRLIDFKAASLHLEVPIVFLPSRKADTSVFGTGFSSSFFTPGIKFKILPSAGISPFVSAGGGLAHFHEGSVSDNRGAFQVGGGLDFKTPLPLLGVRLEARDFITGTPGTPAFTTVTSNHLQNIFVGAGITLHF